MTPEVTTVIIAIMGMFIALVSGYLLGIGDGSRRREWVELTDEEVNELVEHTECEDYYGLVEATEAKLKEKNT